MIFFLLTIFACICNLCFVIVILIIYGDWIGQISNWKASRFGCGCIFTPQFDCYNDPKYSHMAHTNHAFILTNFSADTQPECSYVKEKLG